MTSRHWWKECIYIVDYRARTFTAHNPVLVVLIYNEHKWLEAIKARVSNAPVALSAFANSQLLWKSSSTLNRRVDVILGFEQVDLKGAHK